LNFLETDVIELMDMKNRMPTPAENSRVQICFVLILISFIALSQKGEAQDYKLGVGVRLSNSSPTLANSLTAKYFLSENRAAEGLISFGDRFGLGAIYEIHNKFDVPGLSWLYGGGLYVGFEAGKTYFGPTPIVGIDYKFAAVPINLTLDYKPELDITPKTRFIPDAFALSIRFTIK
jgi:hypothetical protein